MRGIQKKLTDGAVDAVQIVLGKAAARAIPVAFNLPRQGNTGLAVQIASAVAAGMVGEKVLGRAAARMILAGGLSAPIESFVAGAGIPYLSGALQPMGRYPTVGRYPPLGRYPQPELGRYPATNGVAHGAGYGG